MTQTAPSPPPKRRIPLWIKMLALLPFLAWLALAYYNRPDEALDAQAQAWLDEHAKQLERWPDWSAHAAEFPPSDNIHTWLLGFDAPQNTSAPERGVGRLKSAMEYHTTPVKTGSWHDDVGLSPQLDDAWLPPAMRATGAWRSCADADPAPCLEAVTAHPELAQLTLEGHAWLTRRYQDLQQQRSYRLWPRPHASTPLPIHEPAIQLAQRVHLLHAWQQASQGGITESAQSLARDLGWWRSRLHDPGTLQHKRLAATRVRASLLGIAALAQRYPALAREGALQAALMPAFTPNEYALAPVLEPEFLSLLWQLEARKQGSDDGYGGFGLAPGGVGWLVAAVLERPFFKPMATANAQLARHRAMLARTDVPHARYVRQRWDDPAARDQEALAQGQGSLHPYNPVGRRILTPLAPWQEVSDTLHDLEGWRRLVALSLVLQRAGVSGSQLAASPWRSDPAWQDPYTAAAPFWSQGTLQYPGKPLDAAGPDHWQIPFR